MPTVSKQVLDDIRARGIEIRRFLLLVEGLWRGVRSFVPRVCRDSVDYALSQLHAELDGLRGVMVDDVGVEPLSEEEQNELFGGPGGGGK